jgi:hypothetical protein
MKLALLGVVVLPVLLSSVGCGSDKANNQIPPAPERNGGSTGSGSGGRGGSAGRGGAGGMAGQGGASAGGMAGSAAGGAIGGGGAGGSTVTGDAALPPPDATVTSDAASIDTATAPDASGASLTDLEVWPTGVNGPMVWPPELNNAWYMANKNNSVGGYPEGGPPPPLNLITERIKCKSGKKIRPVKSTSAPWEQSRWHPPEYAFDEYPVSRWSSNNANEKWLAGDLGETKTVTQVFLVWETAYG